MNEAVLNEKNKADSFSSYIIGFFIYGVVIWLYKTAGAFAVMPTGDFLSERILYGPYAPYAALEVMAVMGLFHLFSRFGAKKNITPTLIFLIVMSVILFSVFEYFGSLFYEMALGSAPWNYSGKILNINGRVCCEQIVALTVIEVICTYIAQPFLNRKLKGLNIWLRLILALLFVTVVITDIICTFMK